MKTHELKTDSEVFEAVHKKLKNFEIRKDDRGFEVGDLLVLKETEFTGEAMNPNVLWPAPLLFTGREISAVVVYILRGPIYGLKDGWVILSIKEDTEK